MQRDFELMRKILLFAESINSTSRYEELLIDDYSDDAVNHNLQILIDQGYIRESGVYRLISSTNISGNAITHTGHDFLDAARNGTIWRKAMDRVAGTTGSVSLEVLKALLIDQARKLLSLPD